MKKTLVSVAILWGWTALINSASGAAGTLVLNSRTITWQAGLSAQLVDQLSLSGGQPVPAFVKFTNSLTLTNHQFLQSAEVRLEDYFRDASYAALVPPSILTNGPVQALIFAAEHWLPSDRILVPTTTNEFASWAYNPQSNTLNLLVGFWRSTESNVVTSDLGTLGVTGVRYGADNSWAVVVQVEPLTNFVQLLTNLATLPTVKIIQQGPLPYFPLNQQGRASARTDDAQGFSLSTSPVGPSNPTYTKTSGDGVRIAIVDDGINESHKDFHEISGSPSASPPARFYHSAPPGTHIGVHATHVASVAAGNGYDSRAHSPPFRYRGHGPAPLIGNYFTNFGANVDAFYKAIASDGTDVSNHSYVQSWTVYDQLSSSLDEIVRGSGIDSSGKLVPARPAVWGAGNNGFEAKLNYDNEEGYYSVFTSAKNTISVGSVDTEHTPKRLSWYSSLGPTFDGRIKPDLVAPGARNSLTTDEIMAADGSSGYTALSGTSMAAPVVTGVIALMMHQYKKTFSVKPQLYPSSYKALLIHSAVDLIKTVAWPSGEWQNPDTAKPVLYGKGPDFATGYGLVDAEGARIAISQSSLWGEGIIPGSGASQTWCIEVPPGAQELKVAIAWDDESGSLLNPQTAPKLVNDLDLVLVGPDGSSHLPWTLAAPPLTQTPGDGAKDPINAPADIKDAVPGADHLNNVEVASVASPLAGTWRATVTGYDLPHLSGQTFSIVSSHPLTEGCITKTIVFNNVCRFYPRFCDPHYVWIPKLEVVKKAIRFPTEFPVAIDEIAKYVPNFPNRGFGSPKQSCPGFKLKIQGLPKLARILIFDDRDQILVEDASRNSMRTLEVPQRPVGSRLFFLVLPPGSGRLPAIVPLKFEFE